MVVLVGIIVYINLFVNNAGAKFNILRDFYQISEKMAIVQQDYTHLAAYNWLKVLSL